MTEPLLYFLNLVVTLKTLKVCKDVIPDEYESVIVDEYGVIYDHFRTIPTNYLIPTT